MENVRIKIQNETASGGTEVVGGVIYKQKRKGAAPRRTARVAGDMLVLAR